MPASDAAEAAFGSRFAAELARLTEGHLSDSQIDQLSSMSKDALVQKVSARLTWLGLESVQLLSSRGPEEFARAVVREQAREVGDPKEPTDQLPRLGGVLEFLSYLAC